MAFGIRGFFAGVEEASVSAGLELLCGSAFSSPFASPFFAFKGRAFFVAFALAGDDVEGESPATNGSGFTSGSAPRLPSTSCLFAFEALGVFLAALASAEGGERLEEGERSRLTEVEPFDRRGAMLRTVRRKIGRQDNVNDESAGRMMTDAILKIPMGWSCARHHLILCTKMIGFPLASFGTAKRGKTHSRAELIPRKSQPQIQSGVSCFTSQTRSQTSSILYICLNYPSISP